MSHSAIDHRWCRNVVRTKRWHARHSQVCHWCYHHILTSSLIYHCTNPQEHRSSLFYVIKRKMLFMVIQLKQTFQTIQLKLQIKHVTEKHGKKLELRVCETPLGYNPINTLLKRSIILTADHHSQSQHPHPTYPSLLFCKTIHPMCMAHRLNYTNGIFI